MLSAGCSRGPWSAYQLLMLCVSRRYRLLVFGHSFHPFCLLAPPASGLAVAARAEIVYAVSVQFITRFDRILVWTSRWKPRSGG